MQIQFTFVRTDVTIGTDLPPTNAAYLTNDNVFSAPMFGPDGSPADSILFTYTGPAGAGDVTVDFWFWDTNTQMWYVLGSATPVALGDSVYLPFPNIVDRSADRQCPVIQIAAVVTPLGATPVGFYTFGMASTQGYAAGAGGVSPVVPATQVEGIDADDAPATANPVLVGGEYLATPAADPLEDGDAGRQLLNSLRMNVSDLGTKIAGEDIPLDVMRVAEDGTSFLIAAASTTNIKAGNGTLLALVYLNVSAAASTLTAYDNIIAAAPVLIPTHNMTTTEIPGNQPHIVKIGARFTTGLTIVTTGTTDVIVIWR